MKTVDYANTYLFGPLGIPMHENYYVETAEEHKQFIIGKLPKTITITDLKNTDEVFEYLL